ncbi:hypothetical protein IPJ72_07460 [Candidatus Peregrinibacteria bacterium]|nr:MAG: hypothetical protein IPJ72_07460 [Candidatus Peregrinibacteria bacterium]
MLRFFAVMSFAIALALPFGSFADALNDKKTDISNSVVNSNSKEWTDEEIIELGYVPGEVVVNVNLLTNY